FAPLFVPATDAESDHAPADGEPDADHERKHIGADLLARHGRQARAAIGRQTAEGDHEQASHTVGELHALLGWYATQRFRGPLSASPGPSWLSSWRDRPPSWRHPSPCYPRP